jgi:hypothetical protein
VGGNVKLAKLLLQIARLARFGHGDLRFEPLLLFFDMVVKRAGYGWGAMHAHSSY